MSTGNQGMPGWPAEMVDAIAKRVVELMREDQGPLLMTVDQAAERLGRPRRTVYDMVQRGELAAVRENGRGRIMLRRRDVEAAAR